MAAKSPWRKMKVLVLLVLLGMILMRLIWMQLRTYPITLAPCAQAALASWQDPEAASAAPACAVDESAGPWVQSGSHVIRQCADIHQGLFKAYMGKACRDGAFRPRVLVTYNQWLFVATVLLLTLGARFQTSSWFLAMAVAAMLLSRGRLMAGLGHVSPQGLIYAFGALWYASYTHFLRTAALPTFLLSYVAMLGLAFFDVSFLGLFWAVPVTLVAARLLRRVTVLPKLRELRLEQARIRQVTHGGGDWDEPDAPPSQRWFMRFRRFAGLDRDRYQDYEPLANRFARGGLLRPLKVPFVLWAYHGRRTGKILALSVAVALLVTVALLGVGGPEASPAWEGWRAAWADPAAAWAKGGQMLGFWARNWPALIDLDVFVGLSFMTASLLVPSQRGFPGFWEATALLWASLASVTGAAFLVDWQHALTWGLRLGEAEDFAFVGMARSAQVLAWFEPVILSFGMLSIVNAFRMVESITQPRRRKKRAAGALPLASAGPGS